MWQASALTKNPSFADRTQFHKAVQEIVQIPNILITVVPVSIIEPWWWPLPDPCCLLASGSAAAAGCVLATHLASANPCQRSC